MSKSLWRVVWNLKGTQGPRETMEFSQEDMAIGWAEGLLKGGANSITATELIVGRTIRFDSDKTLFTEK